MGITRLVKLNFLRPNVTVMLNKFEIVTSSPPHLNPLMIS